MGHVCFTPESGHVQCEPNVCFGPIADIVAVLEQSRVDKVRLSDRWHKIKARL